MNPPEPQVATKALAKRASSLERWRGPDELWQCRSLKNETSISGYIIL